METTPSANRLHIGIFGRCNSGKSSLLNALAEQQTALVSQTPARRPTRSSKSMEWPGIGAAVVTDTAGFDDDSELGALRLAQTVRAAERCDVALIVCSDADCGLEAEWARRFRERGVPVVAVLGRCDRIRDVPGAVASVARSSACSRSPSAQEPERESHRFGLRWPPRSARGPMPRSRAIL